MTATAEAPTFSQTWFDQNIPLWSVLFGDDMLGWAGKPGLQFLEIGCFEGRATRWLLEHVLTDPSSRILVVDTFQGNPEHASMGVDASGLHKRFMANLAPYQDRVHVNAMTSVTFLRNLRQPMFDGIYLDGSHQAHDVLTDAVLAWPLVKPGGVLIFDDYGWLYRIPETGELIEPGKGIDAWLDAFDGQYELLHKGYQVVVRKHGQSDKVDS